MVQSKVFERVSTDLRLQRRLSSTNSCLSEPLNPGVRIGDSTEIEEAVLTKKVTFIVRVSLVVNVLLLVAKFYAFIFTGSKAVLASLSDSFVDIACQCIITYADMKSHKVDPKYPVGRARLETMGVILCAVTMSLASAAVIEVSVTEFVVGLQGDIPTLHIDLAMYVLLTLTVVAKLLLLVLCLALASVSDVAHTLALDHRNDIISNIAALLAAFAASTYPQLWWVDPIGAVLVSIYIICAWLALAGEQIGKLVGKAAPADFVNHLLLLSRERHGALAVDAVRAYHTGSKFTVEIEVVLPPDMTVQESHDIALGLQQQIEALPEVERAFVHVDYQFRAEPEHRVDRQLNGLAAVIEDTSPSV